MKWNSKMEYNLQRAKTSFFVESAPTANIADMCVQNINTYIYIYIYSFDIMYNYRKTKTKRIIPERTAVPTYIYIRSCTPRPHHSAHT